MIKLKSLIIISFLLISFAVAQKSANNLGVFTGITESGGQAFVSPGQGSFEDRLYLEAFSGAEMVNFTLVLDLPDSTSFTIISGRKEISDNGVLSIKQSKTQYVIDWNGVKGIKKFNAFFIECKNLDKKIAYKISGYVLLLKNGKFRGQVINKTFSINFQDPLLGDFNGDKVVDMKDYKLLKPDIEGTYHYSVYRERIKKIYNGGKPFVDKEKEVRVLKHIFLQYVKKISNTKLTLVWFNKPISQAIKGPGPIIQ